mgnify:CR=1 FL=1
MYVLVIRFAFIIQQLNKMLCLILCDSRGFDGCDICRKKLIIRRKNYTFYTCTLFLNINVIIFLKLIRSFKLSKINKIIFIIYQGV